MKLNKVDYFIRGTEEHGVCQDYAFTTENGIFLADGCSSSPNTDIGARLLLHSMACLEEDLSHDVELIGHRNFWLTRTLKETADTLVNLSVPHNAMDATCVYGVMRNEEFQVYMRGDGVVIVDREKDVLIIIYDYTLNAPNYYSYDIDPERRALYDNIEDNGKYNHKRVKFITYDKATRSVAVVKGHRDTCLTMEQESGLCPILTFGSDNMPNAIILCSDGIESISDPTGVFDTANSLGAEDNSSAFAMVALELLRIGNFSKGFLRRRVNRFLEECTLSWAKHGLRPISWSDDLSFVYANFLEE